MTRCVIHPAYRILGGSTYHKSLICDVRFNKWTSRERRKSSLHWFHNELDGVSDHQPHDCLLTCLFRQRPKKTSKLRVTGLCGGNSPGTSEFPAQKASNAENVSIDDVIMFVIDFGARLLIVSGEIAKRKRAFWITSSADTVMTNSQFRI